MGYLHDALADLVDVVSPLACAGCGDAGSALCSSCAAEFFGPLERVDPGARDLTIPVWSCSRYAGPVRSGIVAWKRGRENLDVHLMEASTVLVDRWAAVRQLDPVPGEVRPLVVVPAPSGWRRRARGQFVVGRMATWVAAALPSASTADVLRRGRGPRHLAGLSARERERSRTDLRVVGRLPPGDVLLVDDVLTTGATLAACAAALRVADPEREIAGALVLAATPRRSSLG